MAQARPADIFDGMKTIATARPVSAPTPEEKKRARKKREALVVKDWRKAIGLLEDTPMSREADALGEEWRRSQVEP